MERRRLSEEIAGEILKKIGILGLKPGELVPSHAVLAKELNVSLPSLREGLQILFDLGHLKTAHGSGTVFKEPSLTEYVSLMKKIKSRLPYSYFEIVDTAKLLFGHLAEGAVLSSTHRKRLAASIEAADPDTEELPQFIKKFFLLFFEKKTNAVSRELFSFTFELVLGKIEELTFSRNLRRRLFGNLQDMIAALDDLKRLNSLFSDLLAIIGEENHCSASSELSLATGALGGSFYHFGTALAAILNGAAGLNCDIIQTEGGLENIDLVESGKALFGISQADAVYDAFHGKGIFQLPHRKIRVVCEIFNLCLYITAADPSIRSIGDLRGKRIALGMLGGDSSRIAKLLLEAHGLMQGDYVPFFLSISKAIYALTAGEADAVFFLDRRDTAEFVSLLDDASTHFLPLEASSLEKLTAEHAFLERVELSAVDSNGPLAAVKVSALLIAHEDAPGKIVSEIYNLLLERKLGKPWNRRNPPKHPGTSKQYVGKRFT